MASAAWRMAVYMSAQIGGPVSEMPPPQAGLLNRNEAVRMIISYKVAGGRYGSRRRRQAI